MMQQTQLPKLHCSKSEQYSEDCLALTCMYACLTTSGHAPNEMTDGVLGDSLRCNVVASDGQKHEVPEVFYWI